MKLNFKPLFDRVVIRADAPKFVTPGGVHLPEGSQSPFHIGEVVAVGDGGWDGGKQITPTVKIGDRVMVVKNPGREITIDGGKYLLMQEKEILGIV